MHRCFYFAFKWWYALCYNIAWVEGVARLSSLELYNRSKCGLFHRNVHNNVQENMAGHLENRVREQVIAKFTTFT